MNAFDRVKREQARMEASLDRINKGVAVSANGVCTSAESYIDPIAAAALRGSQSYHLVGGGWTLVHEESANGLDVVFNRFLDSAFVEPWKTPVERQAQSIAIRAVLRCMYTAASASGLKVTLYTTTKPGVAA